MLAYLQRGGQMVLNFVRPSKKLGWKSFVILGVLVLAMVLVTTPIASADSGLWGTVAGIIASFCLMIATLFLKLTIFLLTFIIQIAAYNGYLDSTAVNYGWVMVRDITNMCFVVILLLIAFGTILGLEQYEWKKLMVKFVLAAILVNFSRVICGVVIDIGQVVMVTFINGVAATAGGNLITMFKMDQIMSLTGSADQPVGDTEVLMASVAAVGFSAMMLGVMCVFMIMLVYRVISLWILIVLSPLAFVFSVIPQTQKYASEWWQQFGNNVVSGPMIAFFLWLAFVTVGGGNINSEIAGASQIPEESKIKDVSEADKIGQQSAGLSKAMSWTNMANFAIAIGMLLLGAEKAQQLGVKGGDMMSKATDFAKKATMVASGAAAGIWAAKGVAKGAKAAGKWGLMNAPLVGGNAWVTRGKSIAGRVGQKFEHFQMGRDRLAKKLEADKKKIDDVKYKVRNKIALTDEDKKVLASEETKGKGAKLFRWAKNSVAASLVETQGRGMKRGDDWMEAYKSAHESREGEYSVSSTPGGYAKLEEGVILESIKFKGGEKKKRKTEALGAAMLDREREERDDMTRELAKKKALGDSATDKDKKRIVELELGIKDFDSRSVARAAAVAAIQAKTEGETKKDATISMDRSILETDMGGALYKATGKAKLAGEGFHAEEEDKTMGAEIKIMEEEAAKLEANGKNTELKALEEKMSALRRAKALLAPTKEPGEVHGTRAEAEAKLAAAQAKKKKKEEDLEVYKGTSGSIPGKEKEDEDRIVKTEQELAESTREVEEAEKTVDKFAKMDEMGKAFDPSAMKDMIDKLSEAIKSKDKDEQKKAVDAIKGNPTMNAAYLSMLGSKKIEDVVVDERNLAALADIKKAIDKSDFVGKDNATAQGILRTSISSDVQSNGEQLGTAWKTASKTAPSVYAARSSAMRDHTYAFYRGKKQEMKDNASQAEIWDKMGIETPSGAAQEAVADELYKKNFANMQYNQLMAAQQAHKNYMKNKKTPIDDRDRLIGLAMVNKFFDESWVDDGTMAVFAKDTGMDMNQFERLKKRSSRNSSSNVRLSKDDISKLGGGLKGLGGLTKEFMDDVRNGVPKAVKELEQNYGRQIQSQSYEFNGQTMDEILHVIQKSQADQYKELIDVVTTK